MEELRKIKLGRISEFFFEEARNKCFKLEKNYDWFTFYYCALFAAGYTKPFEAFIEACEADPSAINWFIEEYFKFKAIENQFLTASSEENDEKKK